MFLHHWSRTVACEAYLSSWIVYSVAASTEAQAESIVRQGFYIGYDARDLDPLLNPRKPGLDQVLVSIDLDLCLALDVIVNSNDTSLLRFYSFLDLKPSRIRVCTGAVRDGQHSIARLATIQYASQ